MRVAQYTWVPSARTIRFQNGAPGSEMAQVEQEEARSGARCSAPSREEGSAPGAQAEDPRTVASRGRERGRRGSGTNAHGDTGCREQRPRNAGCSWMRSASRGRFITGTERPGSRPAGHVQSPAAALRGPEPPGPHAPHEARVRGDGVPRHHQVFLSLAAQTLAKRLASDREPHLHRHLGANALRRRGPPGTGRSRSAIPGDARGGGGTSEQQPIGTRALAAMITIGNS